MGSYARDSESFKFGELGKIYYFAEVESQAVLTQLPSHPRVLVDLFDCYSGLFGLENTEDEILELLADMLHFRDVESVYALFD